MAANDAEVAALKILLVTLYAQTAAKEGSAEKAQEFIERNKNLVLSGIDTTAAERSDFPKDSFVSLRQYVSEFFDSIDFTKAKKP